MKILVHIAVLLALLPSLAHSTAQIPDELILDGQRHPLFTEPLTRHVAETGAYSKLKPYLNAGVCTASWRGFAAQWTVQENRLELSKILANPCDKEPKEVPLKELFAGQEGPILAKWFSGRLVVPLGKQTQYVHMGYESKYERYLALTVDNGIIVERKESEERPR